MWRKVFSTQKDHRKQSSFLEREQGTKPENLPVMRRLWIPGAGEENWGHVMKSIVKH